MLKWVKMTSDMDTQEDPCNYECPYMSAQHLCMYGHPEMIILLYIPFMYAQYIGHTSHGSYSSLSQLPLQVRTKFLFKHFMHIHLNCK